MWLRISASVSRWGGLSPVVEDVLLTSQNHRLGFQFFRQSALCWCDFVLLLPWFRSCSLPLQASICFQCKALLCYSPWVSRYFFSYHSVTTPETGCIGEEINKGTGVLESLAAIHDVSLCILITLFIMFRRCLHPNPGFYQFCSLCNKKESYAPHVYTGFIFRPQRSQRSANEARTTCVGTCGKAIGWWKTSE